MANLYSNPTTGIYLIKLYTHNIKTDDLDFLTCCSIDCIVVVFDRAFLINKNHLIKDKELLEFTR